MNLEKTWVYKAYTENGGWVATIRHFNDQDAVAMLREQYDYQIGIIMAGDEVVWVYKPGEAVKVRLLNLIKKNKAI